jgi:hypothetical protein
VVLGKRKEITMQDSDNYGAPEIASPKNFKISLYDDYMQITRTWYSLQLCIGMLMFVFVFNGLWISEDFFGLLASDKPLLLKGFALLFICIGIGAAYFNIALFLNKTEILVSPDAIAIRHHPIPWFGKKIVETKNIKQLFVKEKIWGYRNNSKKLTYNLLGQTHEGKSFKLITGFPVSNQALYIEQEVEKYLGIENESETAC